MIGGTKWPSITSTWITRAPAASTSPTCSPSRAEVGREDRRRDLHAAEQPASDVDPASRSYQIGCSMLSPQLLHLTIAVLDMRTIVECSPQFGQTEVSSKRCRQYTQR